MELTIVKTTLQTVADVVNKIKEVTGYTQDRSINEISKLTRVEPLTIISKDLLNLEYLPDINQSLLSLFSAYYLQAVSLLTKVHDVEVVRLLDSLNPDRDETGFLLSANLATESLNNLKGSSYLYTLPTSRTLALEATPVYQTGNSNIDQKQKLEFEKDKWKEQSQQTKDKMELDAGKWKEQKEREDAKLKADRDNKLADIGSDQAFKEKMYDKQVEDSKMQAWELDAKYGNKELANLNEVSNLSVGKLLNVEIAYDNEKDGKKTAKFVRIPVQIRLIASILPNSTINHLLTSKTEDHSITERYHTWRSGRISFIKDLIFCQDLIDEHKKAMMGDESGTMLEIVRRVNNAKKYGLLTKNPSLVSASNIFVISEEVAKEIEYKLGGKFSNQKIRQKAFENTYAMIIVVVSREWERVTFYTRGINQSADFSIKEIKSATKGKGIDIADVMKSLSTGMAPQF